MLTLKQLEKVFKNRDVSMEPPTVSVAPPYPMRPNGDAVLPGLTIDNDNKMDLENQRRFHRYVSKYIDAGNNPLKNWVEARGVTTLSAFETRLFNAVHLSWAIPNEEALAMLLHHSPLIEIGAGTGYWAALIRARGGQVAAYDEEPGPDRSQTLTEEYGSWGKPGWWHPVHRGGPESVLLLPKHTLFLCWPPYDTPFADNCLSTYKGDVFCYVGETGYGCCGDDAFHNRLDREWGVETYIPIPTYMGIHDGFMIYRRKLPQQLSLMENR